MSGNIISISRDEKEFARGLRALQLTQKSLTPKFMKSTHRRNLKPMLLDMKGNSKSLRLAQMIAVTTAKRKAGDYGAKIGVVKNNVKLFPKFSAPALASVIEYGTNERFTNAGASKGSVTMEPWLRPAWDRGVKGYMDRTEKSIIKKVEGELNG